MALQGTLKDFALPDILQLIGIQRKTGILTMENDDDTVTVQFVQGQVVGADTRLRKLEDLLGSVLVRTGRITDAQLREVLAIQRETLQRLGYVLVKSGCLSEDDLRDALRIQINQIVYRLFRWRDGRYNFAAMDHLEYDRNLTIPISAETILMEAARMIDEWPLIERRIKSPQMALRKTAAGLEFEGAAVAVPLDDSDFDLDLFGDASAAPKQVEGAVPTPEESEILRLMDGRGTVQDVVDRSAMGEFDVHRLLCDFLQRGLVEEAPAAVRVDPKQVRRVRDALESRMAVALVFVLVALSVLTTSFNGLAPWRIGNASGDKDRLRAYVSRAKLERVERAIQTFYLDHGTAPERLRALVAGGYLAHDDVLDPWGRPVSYEVRGDGYVLSGADAAGQPAEELTLVHPFTASQRAILEGPASGGEGERRAHP